MHIMYVKGTGHGGAFSVFPVHVDVERNEGRARGWGENRGLSSLPCLSLLAHLLVMGTLQFIS